MSEATPSEQRMRAVAGRIDALVRDFDASPDAVTRRQVRELTRQLMTLYGAGLTRILEILELEDRHAGRPPGETAAALRADDLVASLLVLHDLHPESVETRILRVLERVPPVAGIRVTLLEVGDATIRLRAESLNNVAPPSHLDLRPLIESLIQAVAPDVVRVDIEGLPDATPPPLVQLARKPPADRSTEESVS